MSVNKYVDLFYGNFEPCLPKPNETASKWFFLKAQAGNTTPAAVRPFGMVSACAYTGGYPTGYGPYLPNSYARPARFMNTEAMTALGFSHFHQSGTGYISYFYNYSIITPVNGTAHKRLMRYALEDEKAEPGFYSCTLGGVRSCMTVSASGAIYTFQFSDGEKNTVVFDAALNGIFKDTETPMSPDGKIICISAVGHNGCESSVAFESGITLHTAIHCDECVDAHLTYDKRICMTVKGKRATVYVGFSFANMDKARASLGMSCAQGFDRARAESAAMWEAALGKIQIEAPEAYKTKFYSNLYHSLIKPINITDNNAFWHGGDCYCDLATLWDMGKTQLPLVFSLFGETSSGIIRSMIKSAQLLGHFPNSFLLMDFLKYPGPCDMQARALSVNCMYDAYLRGVQGIDWNEALECMIADMKYEANRPFLEGKTVSEYPSHTVDLAVAAYSISELARALGKNEIADKYAALSDNWALVYDKETGVITEEGSFYEGCNLNYSFRLLPNMQKRIEIAGGEEKFERSLDEFFGFDRPAAVQCLDVNDKKAMRDGEARRGFEGFNNETDMETPWCYSYIGRHDKACDIVRSGEKYMFGMSGRGAYCGNEDSGAISSLYVVNALGIFPCFGQNRIILGSPAMKSAALVLANGNILNITVENFDENKFVPSEIYFNGKQLDAPFITVSEMMMGGEIKFVM